MLVQCTLDTSSSQPSALCQRWGMLPYSHGVVRKDAVAVCAYSVYLNALSNCVMLPCMQLWACYTHFAICCHCCTCRCGLWWWRLHGPCAVKAANAVQVVIARLGLARAAHAYSPQHAATRSKMVTRVMLTAAGPVTASAACLARATPMVTASAGVQERQVCRRTNLLQQHQRWQGDR